MHVPKIIPISSKSYPVMAERATKAYLTETVRLEKDNDRVLAVKKASTSKKTKPSGLNVQ